MLFLTDSSDIAPAPRCVAIGNFDGVHLGHRTLLKMASAQAAAEGSLACALTFEPHPKEFFRPWTQALARVNNRADKFLDIASCGIGEMIQWHFDERFASLRPEVFAREVLVSRLHAASVVVGDDFRFGAKGLGSLETLEELGRALGFAVHTAPTYLVDGERVSSTRLRAALKDGNMRLARALLGESYHVTGRVIHGEELGRTLGYPTINMDALPVNADNLPVLEGVFAVWVHGLADRPMAGMASITTRPTVGQSQKFLLETHIFDYEAQCYGALARIEFVDKIRDAKKFDGLEALKRALAADAVAARAVLAREDASPSLAAAKLPADLPATLFTQP